jgi:energy-coupling factor transporter transmembrane protein EcfT
VNGQQEEGFTLHWGCLIVGAILSAGAVVIFVTLGWRWLWIIPAAAVGFWAIMLVISVFEDRWLAVTPQHLRRGVPAECSACGEEWDVIVGKTRFKTRCPICGHRGSGDLLET